MIKSKKKISQILMIVFYITTGLFHFLRPSSFIKIMPSWLPMHNVVNIISGGCEILFALLLVFPFTRAVAAWCIIVLLIAVFPANIQMMLNYYYENDPGLWLTVLRLPLQIVLIIWAFGFTRPVNKSPLSRRII